MITKLTSIFFLWAATTLMNQDHSLTLKFQATDLALMIPLYHLTDINLKKSAMIINNISEQKHIDKRLK